MTVSNTEKAEITAVIADIAKRKECTVEYAERGKDGPDGRAEHFTYTIMLNQLADSLAKKMSSPGLMLARLYSHFESETTSKTPFSFSISSAVTLTFYPPRINSEDNADREVADVIVAIAHREDITAQFSERGMDGPGGRAEHFTSTILHNTLADYLVTNVTNLGVLLARVISHFDDPKCKETRLTYKVSDTLTLTFN